MTKNTHPLSTIDFMKSIPDTEELNEEKAAQIVAQKHAELKKMTAEVKEELSLLSQDIEKSKQDIERLCALEENKRKSFFAPLFKRKRKPIEIDYLEREKQVIPIVKKYIEAPYQIVDSKSLLSYASSWLKTIFENKVQMKALPSTGTVLIILPKGHFHFVQFAHGTTPLHIRQTAFQESLSPLKVNVFRNFYDFRNWIYEQMSTL